VPAGFDWRRRLSGSRRLAVAVAGVALWLSGGAGAASALPEVFVVDPGVSTVRVHLGRSGLLKFMGHDHEIDAPIARGRVEVDASDPARSRVDMRWDTPLLAIVPGTEPEKDVENVEKRMRSSEVLDVDQYPGIRFWSFEISIEEADPEAGRWRLHVRGGLELKGARHTVEVPLEVVRDGDVVVATGEASLRLRRLGIEPPSVAGVVKVSDDFRVSFEVRARREEPLPAPTP